MVDLFVHLGHDLASPVAPRESRFLPPLDLLTPFPSGESVPFLRVPQRSPHPPNYNPSSYSHSCHSSAMTARLPVPAIPVHLELAPFVPFPSPVPVSWPLDASVLPVPAHACPPSQCPFLQGVVPPFAVFALPDSLPSVAIHVFCSDPLLPVARPLH